MTFSLSVEELTTDVAAETDGLPEEAKKEALQRAGLSVWNSKRPRGSIDFEHELGSCLWELPSSP